jgi:drug/metabolite transporter (DMT)-like permease
MATMTHDTPTTRATSGMGAALVSAWSFGLAGPLARGLMDAGWSPAAAVVMRILVAAAVLLPGAVVALRGRWAGVWRHLPLMALYGIVPVAGAQFGYFNAVVHMPVGVAILVEFTAPVAVVGWLWLRHRQRPTRATVLGAAVAAVGLLLVLDLTSSTSVSAIGVAWALVAMLGASFYFVLSSRVDDGLPGIVLAAGGLTVGGTVLLLAGVAGIVPLAVSTAPVALGGAVLPWWVVVALLGVVTAALGYVSGIAATRRLGARLASFVALSEVLAALVFAWLLLGEVPRGIQLLGGVLVVTGVVAVRRGEPATA